MKVRVRYARSRAGARPENTSRAPTENAIVPKTTRSGSELAVAGALAPFRMVVTRVAPAATGGITGVGGMPLIGVSTESDAVVGVGAKPAAESTHVFMLVILAAVTLSACAF